MVANPGSLGSLVRAHPEKAIAEELRDLKRRVRSLESVRTNLTFQPSVTAAPFTLDTSFASVASITAVVPGGFTTAAVIVAGTVTATRSGGGAGIVSIKTLVGPTSAGIDTYNFPASTTDATCVQVFGSTLTDLSNGDSFALTVQAKTASATPWDALGGSGNLYAFITYLR